VAELSGQCDTNTEQIAALNTRCDTLTDDVRALSGQEGTYTEQLAELREACESNTQNVQTLTDSVSTLTDNMSALTEDCRESLETVAEFSGQCAANKEDIAALNTRCENIDNDLNTTAQTANKNKTDLSTLSGKHDALAAEVEELAESVDLVTRPSVRWCAMGDSITYGYTSAFASGQTPNGTNKGTQSYKPAEAWVAKLAALNNWAVTNRGVSNTGWITNSTDNNPNATPKINAAWNVAADINFNSYDIVTLAYGTNDWAYNKPLGTMNDSYASPTTIIGGIRKTIETIIASNPYCKIFVITPLNRLGNYMKDPEDDTKYIYLQESYNWALGLAKTNAKTLEDVFNGIKTVCEFYGVEMIDMTHTSIANRKNLPTVLPDFVHPSVAAHTALAHELAAKIHYI
jgi:archaellum component FlaC